jgi:hypothetical protein
LVVQREMQIKSQILWGRILFEKANSLSLVQEIPDIESYPQDPAFRPHSEPHDIGHIPTLCLFKIPFNIIYAFFRSK